MCLKAVGSVTHGYQQPSVFSQAHLTSMNFSIPHFTKDEHLAPNELAHQSWCRRIPLFAALLMLLVLVLIDPLFAGVALFSGLALVLLLIWLAVRKVWNARKNARVMQHSANF